MNANSITIEQKNWAFTSSQSKHPIIKTNTFGPGYVATFISKASAYYDQRFVAVVHIDQTTELASMKDIFNRFSRHSVLWQDVKVTILGGWVEDSKSKKLGQKILDFINPKGFANVNCQQMWVKTPYMTGIPLNKHYCFGALVDARKGKVSLSRKTTGEAEKLCMDPGYGELFPITEIKPKEMASDPTLEMDSYVDLPSSEEIEPQKSCLTQ